MEQNSQLQQDRREVRRKRRVRNQVMAYMAVILLIIATAAGIVYGVRYIRAAGKSDEQAKEQEKQDQQDQLEQMLGTEETLTEPEPVSAEPEPEPEPEPTPQQKLDEIINAQIEVMSLEDKVAGLFIVTPESITGVNTALKAGNGTREALTQYAVGGIIYSKKNMQGEKQLKEMIENTRQFASYPLFIAVEDEGGSFSPLAQAGLAARTDGAVAIAETKDAMNAYQAGGTIGTYLHDYGFDLDFAPVADLVSADHSVMEKRSYGSDAGAVSAFVTSMLQGLKEQKVTVCLKHFPGMGSTAQDTDKGLASTDRSAEDFRANEFAVFQAGIDAGADMVMVSHMSAPGLTNDNMPCSLSSAVVTDILRNEMHFDGVIITDAMNIAAISEYYGADQAAVMALRAGCDMILAPEDFAKAYNGVLDAVKNGEISEERVNDALRRIYRIKDADKLEE